jgi:hypothetical protein
MTCSAQLPAITDLNKIGWCAYKQYVIDIHRKVRKTVAVVRFVRFVSSGDRHPIDATPAFSERGIWSIVHKTFLPLHDVFDEQRYFTTALTSIRKKIKDQRSTVSLGTCGVCGSCG